MPFAADAYAYVHLLERYRRTWVTLEHLSDLAVLPLGVNGVRVLDIGTGPGSALYAIDDFYAALSDFAENSGLVELRLPAPQLACVESSPSMTRFFQAFSEFAGRSGPFTPMAVDFAGLDLASRREAYRRQNETEDLWDEETQQYEEIYDPVTASAEAERLFRFRLVVLSNFLTLESDIERFEGDLRGLFSDLKAGGVVLVLGATGDNYQKLYERLSTIAQGAGLAEGGWHTDSLGRIDPSDPAAVVIKGAQHRVYQYLEGLVGPSSLKREKSWPDYWDPTPSQRARPQFGLRVFRTGRWPKTRGAA